MRVDDVMAELVGPARCKADILPGRWMVTDTYGPPRADSMMAREAFFPPERPDLRVHPTRLARMVNLDSASPKPLLRRHWEGSG